MARTTFYQTNYVGWPPVHIRDHANPNSKHWEEMALSAWNRLIDRIGPGVADAWIDQLPEPTTYKSIHDAIVSKLNEPGECECREDRVMVCPHCRAVIRQSIGDEIPY